MLHVKRGQQNRSIQEKPAVFQPMHPSPVFLFHEGAINHSPVLSKESNAQINKCNVECFPEKEIWHFRIKNSSIYFTHHYYTNKEERRQLSLRFDSAPLPSGHLFRDAMHYIT